MGVERLELEPNEGASGVGGEEGGGESYRIKNRMNDIEIDESQQQQKTKKKR